MRRDVDGRDKPGHDDVGAGESLSSDHSGARISANPEARDSGFGPADRPGM